jgi:uncharacterized FlaG/YvyC family protein
VLQVNNEQDYYQEPSFMGRTAEKIGKIATANGYDQEEVDDWMRTKQGAWTELSERQDKESAQMAQQDIKEATEYISGIINSMITEVRAKYDEANKQISSKVSDKLEAVRS